MAKLQLIFLSKLSFLDILNKNHHIHFLVHGHSSWFTFGLHQRLCKSDFQETRPWKVDHEVGQWKKANFHGPTSWSMV